MRPGVRTEGLRWLILAVAVALVSTAALAGQPAAKAPAATAGTSAVTTAETVEMFAAIKAGHIEVKLIPKDSTECRVLIHNKTDKPLSIQLPSAFAGVPVLAQPGGFGGAGVGGLGGRAGRGLGGGVGTMGGGMNQGFGGGMGGWGGGMGMGGMGMGGMGMWNVPPEKDAKFKVPIVCLEHGKRDPRPAVPYEIKPIDQFTDKVEVHELCRMLGTGTIPQRVAQAAAWNLANGMSWQELSAKQLQFANGMRAPYFSPQEVQAAMQLAAEATRLAQQRQSTPSQNTPSQDTISQR